MTAVLLYLAAYVVGSIPFGVMVARAKGVDIMAVGSGNIGATNVGRTLGRAAGLLTFTLDTGKGAAMALLALLVFRPTDFGWRPVDHAAICGALAVVGHMFSPFLGFRGGKGVATGLGAALAVSPFVGLAAFAVFGLVLLVSRMVSLSSVIAVTTVFVFAPFTHASAVFYAAFAAVVLGIWVKHGENLQRIRNGTERKVSFSKKQGGDPSEHKNKDAGENHAG